MTDPNGVFGTNNTMPGAIDVTGATLQGAIKCTYGDLVHAFGDPVNTDTEVYWLVIFNDFTVAKVFKPNPVEIEPSQYWDIFGFGQAAFIRVSTAVQRSLREAA